MWFTKSKTDVLHELEVDSSIGLTSQQAQERFEKYGPNALKGSRKKFDRAVFFAVKRRIDLCVVGSCCCNDFYRRIHGFHHYFIGCHPQRRYRRCRRNIKPRKPWKRCNR